MIKTHTRSTRQERATRSGFTLIELLVVVSVIALLIGLLLPALAHSRRAARAGQCMSQLRQHGVAFNLYTIDYGALPHEDDSNHPTIICWYFAVNPYLGVKNDESLFGEGDYFPQIKLCPEVDRSVPSFFKSYRFNSGLETNTKPFLPPEWMHVATATPILFDAEYSGTGVSFKGRANKVDARHNDSANILMGDWHVEAVRKKAVDSLRWKLE